MGHRVWYVSMHAETLSERVNQPLVHLCWSFAAAKAVARALVRENAAFNRDFVAAHEQIDLAIRPDTPYKVEMGDDIWLWIFPTVVE